jgi:glycosyltransferase involved in cell wall biosynthesis
VVHAVRENPNIHFMLIGDGKLRGNVEKIIAENNMQNHVTLLGTVTHHLVPSYLSLCQILLSPHTENTDGTLFFGSPTKLFEYMGMGKAIIASAVGQIADIIKDGHNGVLVKQRDPVDLAHAIIRLTQEPELCHILGKNARYDAVTTYSWKHNAQRVINVVQSL